MTTPKMTAAAISIALLALTACNKPGAGAPGATNDANNSLASSSPVLAGAQDSTAAAVGGVSAATTTTAQGFVTGAATSDMYEIQAATLAKEKATNAAVKHFAAKMIHEHKASSAKLMHIVADPSLNLAPPADLDERRKGLENNLTVAAPADFDKTYIDQQVAAHQEAVTLFKGYVDNGDNAALKAFAVATLPTIESHLAMAKALQSSMSK